MKRIFRTLVVAISTAFIAGFVAVSLPAGAADTSTSDRYISVTGTGMISVVPDAVKFNVTVSVVAVSNSAALSSASKIASAVRKALISNGITTKDIKSASISVYPDYQWTQEAGTKIIGYRGSQSFDVLVRKSSNAGNVISAVIEAGGNDIQLSGVIPVVLNTTTATEDVRAAAVTNAKSKASSYAKLLGTSIGKVISLEEISSPVYSTPYPMAKASADTEAVELDLGAQDVTIIITVRWTLN